MRGLRKRVEFDSLAISHGVGDARLTVALEDRAQQSVTLVVVRLQYKVAGRHLLLVARRQDQVLAALTFVQPRWPDVLDGGLPAVINGPGDRAVRACRWNLQHDRANILRIEKRHQVDGVRVGGKRLIFPIEEARPEDDLV